MNMKFSQNDKRDVSVELLRIIAAIVVIGVHVNQGFYYYDKLRPTGVLISCFVGDGVAFFWMIMGFFLFDSDYKKVIKRSIKRVLVPMFVYEALMFYMGDFLSGGTKDIFFGFKRSISDYTNLLIEGLLRWRTVIGYTGHFWYLYCYMVVAVLAFPILKRIIDYYQEHNSFKTLFIVLSILIVANDIVLNGLIGFSLSPFQGTFGACFIILFGYMIYRRKTMFENKALIGILGLFSFLCINIVRTVLQYHLAAIGKSNHLIFWFSSFAVLTSYSLIVFCFGIKKLISGRIISSVIRHLSSLSMGVYFVHVLIISALTNFGIMSKLDEMRTDSGISILVTQLYKMGITILCSLIVVEIYTLIKKLIMRGTKAYFSGRELKKMD